nr:SubclassB3_beta_lactamase [uncultured bacterium]
MAGPIYYVGTRGLAVYLIKTKVGLILISGGPPKTENLIADSVKKLGFNLKDIRLLLSSHAHFDHIGTLAALKNLTGASVAIMDADVELLKSGGKTDYLYANRPELHFDGVTPDRILRDGETVNLGGTQLIAHRTPGHTRGCTTWEMNIAVGGRHHKVVFADGTGINPGTRFVKNPSYPGIREDYQSTFRVLESLRPDIFLSYHAEFFGFEAKRQGMAKEGFRAWLDAEGYRASILKKREAFEKLVRDEELPNG